jgi:adhesin transport system outer membrane protein
MGMTRNAWESLRKKRITEKRGDIQATASQLRPVRCDAPSAEVAFTQGYGSTDYRDEVEKTLLLERLQGTWKITRETVTKGRTY